MKNILILILLVMLLTNTISGSRNPAEHEDCVVIEESEHIVITKDEMGYDCTVYDKNGDVLFSSENLPKEPAVDQIDTNILGISNQSGTGLSTRWTVYCDVENSIVSEDFYYVLAAQGNYVIYANYENGVHSIIVQNIFNKAQYYQEHVLENCAPVADVVVNGKLNGEGSVIVTYLTGSDYTETDIVIDFP